MPCHCTCQSFRLKLERKAFSCLFYICYSRVRVSYLDSLVIVTAETVHELRLKLSRRDIESLLVGFFFGRLSLQTIYNMILFNCVLSFDVMTCKWTRKPITYIFFLQWRLSPFLHLSLIHIQKPTA